MREFAPDKKLLERGEALTEIDRWEEAIPLFTRYLTQEPDSHRANCFLSACFYHLKNTKEALKFAEKGILYKPDDEWGHRLRSLALSLEKRHKEALVSAREAVRLAPEEPLAIQRLMNAYLNCGMTKEALQEGEKLRSLQPEKEDALVTMGFILMESKRYKEAETLFYQALQINPTCSTALNNLGVIYLRLNDEDKAFEFFQKAIQADPNDKLAQDNLKITVKYKPIWLTVAIFIAVGLVFPISFIGLFIYLAANFKKLRRFYKLPPSVQRFLKSQDKTYKSFADFLDAKHTLFLVRVVFVMILLMAIITVIVFLISDVTFSSPFFETVFKAISYFMILGIFDLPVGLFWIYLERRNQPLR